MKRTIKFRAWHKSQKRMIYWADYSSGPMHLYYVAKDIIDYHGGEDNVILMQHIEQTDANGTPIYYGDIVECEEWIEGKGKAKGDIYFEPSLSAPMLGCLDEDNWCVDWDISDLGGFIVVGNVYEDEEYNMRRKNLNLIEDMLSI